MKETLMLLALLSAPGQDPKPPVPDAAALRDAEKLVREVFKEDFAKRTPADRIALAKKLLKQGNESKEDPASQFVLFSESRDIASQAGDLDTALAAIGQLGRAFAVDPVPMKSAVLTAAAKSAKTPEELQKLARAWLLLAEDSAAAEKYDAAEKAADQAAQLAKRAKDLTLATNVTAKGKEYAELRVKTERMERAREALGKNAGDPEANLAVGQYLCFVKGDWETGLAHLARGSDPGLKNLATKEAAKPAEPSDQVALGDAWWDLAEKDAILRPHLRLRAGFWYSLAREKLAGLTRARIDKRIESLGSIPLPGPKPSAIPPDAPVLNGHSYKLYSEILTWEEAKEFCAKLGGHLVTITSKDEALFVAGLFPGAPKENGPWIGLSYDPKDKSWKWVTGEPFKYSAWAPNEPNLLESGHHRVVIAARGIGEYWNNVGPEHHHPFICEWDR